MSQERQYLGDGVYAEFDGYQIWLLTSDGYSITNRIALEPSVFHALVRFLRTMPRLRRAEEAQAEEDRNAHAEMGDEE